MCAMTGCSPHRSSAYLFVALLVLRVLFVLALLSGLLRGVQDEGAELRRSRAKGHGIQFATPASNLHKRRSLVYNAWIQVANKSMARRWLSGARIPRHSKCRCESLKCSIFTLSGGWLRTNFLDHNHSTPCGTCPPSPWHHRRSTCGRSRRS